MAPLAPTFGTLLAVRALQGVAMAGVPALAMAHLAAEVNPRSLGGAMGILIAGNTSGGLIGRIVATTVADLMGWRWALAVVGIVSLGFLVAFRLLIPEPRSSPPASVSAMTLMRHTRSHVANPTVVATCLISCVGMSTFVSVYNYLGFRLEAAPFGLSPALIGLVFLLYLFGTASSTMAGIVGDRRGRYPVLIGGVLLVIAGALVTMPDVLPLVLAGVGLVTIGFFAVHASASSLLNERVVTAPAQASALYLFSYYAGSSVGGTVGGIAFKDGGWPALMGFVVLLQLCALTSTVWLLLRTSRTRARQAVAGVAQGEG